MSMESEQTFALSKFQEVVLEGFFRDAPAGIADLGRRLCRWLWELDGRCHTQDWEGGADRLAVYSLPVHLRRWRTSKNYAAVYRPLPGDPDVILEVILPRRADVRDALLARFADRMSLEAHTLGQLRFRLTRLDATAPYEELILATRAAKARPLAEHLRRGRREDASAPV